MILPTTQSIAVRLIYELIDAECKEDAVLLHVARENLIHLSLLAFPAGSKPPRVQSLRQRSQLAIELYRLSIIEQRLTDPSLSGAQQAHALEERSRVFRRLVDIAVRPTRARRAKRGAR